MEKNIPNSLFCYSHRPAMDSNDINGWSFFNLEKEYNRMGIPNNHWTIAKVNENYEMCESYPEIYALPAQFDQKGLPEVSKFRSRGRIPLLCYYYAYTGATITRCSQPSGISLYTY